ncbi:hypothetical protein [Brucella anthropi]|uniref:hypothetical protein n=1 Tax=Brucella anthropi TaxID=529 RepID=UPI00235DFE57|nr:hypothetical protein [Brucella anthropi]
MSYSVFVAPARTLLAQLLYDQPLTIAVGSGDPAWDSLPPPATPDDLEKFLGELSQETALTNPVGFTRVRNKTFVVPDAKGDIIMSDGTKWSKSSDPSNAFLVEGLLDLTDAIDVTLRENGVYAGTEFDDTVLPGQMYIPLANVKTLGTLVELTRFPPIVRDGSLSQSLREIPEI